jgi:hypothetical protein|nr:MAG TPA: hypothetical protein [Caudoviricetes sp.]
MGRLALNKKVDISKLIDGWDGAYIIVSPMLTKDMAEFAGSNFDEADKAQLSAQTLEWAKKKFVRGKVYIETETGKELVDMQVEDIDELPFVVVTEIFAVLVGKDFDPKASATAQSGVLEPMSVAAVTGALY